MTGLELQRKLSESGHRFPVIFVSAYGNGPEEEQARQFGASDFLRKPFSERALINAIKIALRRKLQNGERGNS
jgi:FixJ family two-component response regulator